MGDGWRSDSDRVRSGSVGSGAAPAPVAMGVVGNAAAVGEITAEQTARQWFDRLGEGWPHGLSMNDPIVAPLLEALGVGVAAGLDGNDAAAIDRAFQKFRREFAPVWRALQQKEGAA